MIPARHVTRVDVVRRIDAAPLPGRAFLSLHRLELANVYSDGAVSRTYPYDAVLRRHLDAVALLLTTGGDGAPRVCMRSCVRPPLLLRGGAVTPLEEAPGPPCLWELPAGLIEDADRGVDGIRSRASAEAFEEVGVRIPADRFTVLAGAPFVSPGVIPERLFFARAEVARPEDATPPAGDGSPVEERAEIAWVALEEAIAMCDRGEIEDMKTELGLRRLAASRRAGEEPLR
ncbi:MAG: NUDIX hydrolase [Proteobacteria bacterium]|nr:NUDIX hydrolase [Pseudomonadota bacterium]